MGSLGRIQPQPQQPSPRGSLVAVDLRNPRSTIGGSAIPLSDTVARNLSQILTGFSCILLQLRLGRRKRIWKAMSVGEKIEVGYYCRWQRTHPQHREARIKEPHARQSPNPRGETLTMLVNASSNIQQVSTMTRPFTGLPSQTPPCESSTHPHPPCATLCASPA